FLHGTGQGETSLLVPDDGWRDRSHRQAERPVGWERTCPGNEPVARPAGRPPRCHIDASPRAGGAGAGMKGKPRQVLQAEAAECGLASLAMVSAAHGLVVTLPELRQRFPLSLKGARLDQLIRIAQQLGFSTRPLRLELEELGQLRLPCILHWDLNHFVVLSKVERGRVVVLDPAFGERRLPLQPVSRHLTGVALELTPAPGFKPRKPAPATTARELTGPVTGPWRALAQVLLLAVAPQVFGVLAPFLMQWVVDQVLVSADCDLLAVLGIGFGLALLLQIGIGLLRGWSVVYLSTRLGLQWMGNVFAHVLRLPLDRKSVVWVKSGVPTTY